MPAAKRVELMMSAIVMPSATAMSLRSSVEKAFLKLKRS